MCQTHYCSRASEWFQKNEHTSVYTHFTAAARPLRNIHVIGKSFSHLPSRERVSVKLPVWCACWSSSTAKRCPVKPVNPQTLFTPVVSGDPITSGLTPGDRLRSDTSQRQVWAGSSQCYGPDLLREHVFEWLCPMITFRFHRKPLLIPRLTAETPTRWSDILAQPA